MKENRIVVQKDMVFGIFDVYIKSGNGWVVQMEVETIPEGECYPTPVTPLKMDNTAAQALMDNLWDCGVRPSNGTGSAGSLAATERHLKDMQAIVFDNFLKGEKK